MPDRHSIRFRLPTLSHLPVVVLLALVFGVLATDRTSAQFEPAGSITLNGLLAGDDLGGGVTLDLGVPIGDMLRVGGVVGALALVSDNEDASRVFLPLGISAALTINTGAFFADLRVRAGMWGGATNEGLTAGSFVGAGAFIGYALSEDVGVVVGLEAWYTLGGEAERVLLLPGLGFVWRPGASQEIASDLLDEGTDPDDAPPGDLGPPELGPSDSDTSEDTSESEQESPRPRPGSGPAAFGEDLIDALEGRSTPDPVPVPNNTSDAGPGPTQETQP